MCTTHDTATYRRGSWTISRVQYRAGNTIYISVYDVPRKLDDQSGALRVCLELAKEEREARAQGDTECLALGLGVLQLLLVRALAASLGGRAP